VIPALGSHREAGGRETAPSVETTAPPAAVEALKPTRPNKVMEAADTAIGPQERKPRKRKVLSP